MTRLTIRRYPDPALKAAAETVTDFGPELATLANDLYETMKAAPGVGITAPHCGILKRLTVIDLRDELIALGGAHAQALARQRPVRAALDQAMCSEAQALRDAEAARRKVIDVDDFSKEELSQAEGKTR